MAWKIEVDGDRAVAQSDDGREYGLDQLVAAIQTTPTPELLGLLPRLASAHKRAVSAKLKADEQAQAAAEARARMEAHIRPVEDALQSYWPVDPDQAEISYIFSSGIIKAVCRVSDHDKEILSEHAEALGRTVRLKLADGRLVVSPTSPRRLSGGSGNRAPSTPQIDPGTYQIQTDKLLDPAKAPVVIVTVAGNRVAYQIDGQRLSAADILATYTTCRPADNPDRPYAYASADLRKILTQT